MSNAHYPLLDCVIYILVSIIILLSKSVGSNRVYVTDDSGIIEGRLRTCSIHSPSYIILLAVFTLDDYKDARSAVFLFPPPQQ